MSFIHELSKTITASTLGVGSGISTGHINGFISDIYVSVDKEMASTDLVTISMSSDADRTVLAISPSTLGAYYHPRVAPISTTGITLASTDGNGGAPISFYKEKFKVSVVGGTSLCAAGTTTADAIISVKVRWY